MEYDLIIVGILFIFILEKNIQRIYKTCNLKKILFLKYI